MKDNFIMISLVKFFRQKYTLFWNLPDSLQKIFSFL